MTRLRMNQVMPTADISVPARAVAGRCQATRPTATKSRPVPAAAVASQAEKSVQRHWCHWRSDAAADPTPTTATANGSQRLVAATLAVHVVTAKQRRHGDPASSGTFQRRY